jgi:hypothetical protein
MHQDEMAVGAIGKLNMVQRLSPLEAQRRQTGRSHRKSHSRNANNAVGHAWVAGPSAKTNSAISSAASLRPPCCQIRQLGRAFTAQTLLPIVIEEEFNIAPAPLITRESVTTLFNRICPPVRRHGSRRMRHEDQLPGRSVHGSRNPY